MSTLSTWVESTVAGKPTAWENADALATLLTEEQIKGDHLGNTMIVSFADTAIERFHLHAPDYDIATGTEWTALLWATSQGPLPGVADGRHAAVQPPEVFSGITVLTEDFVADAHANGLAVHPWTINDARDHGEAAGLERRRHHDRQAVDARSDPRAPPRLAAPTARPPRRGILRGEMTDAAPTGQTIAAGLEPLALTVGCRFDLGSTQPAVAIAQVAPRHDPGLSILGERWDTSADHHAYTDLYGNRCERFELAAGDSHIAYEADVVVRRPADLIEPETPETPVELLPDEVITFVMPSRYCLPDELGQEAWQRFGDLDPGWGRVQAIVDYVHGYLEFVPGASNPWTTAADVNRAGQGVCRDFAHLAITFCRALNIPARYVFGYIPNVGIPPPAEEMDFAAWFEAYLDGRWHTFDARNNIPRIGRVVVGRGRDAVDVALLTSFGPLTLNGFVVRAAPSIAPAA